MKLVGVHPFFGIGHDSFDPAMKSSSLKPQAVLDSYRSWAIMIPSWHLTLHHQCPKKMLKNSLKKVHVGVVSKNRGKKTPQNGWFIIMENPYFVVDDLRGFIHPYFWVNIHVNPKSLFLFLFCVCVFNLPTSPGYSFQLFLSEDRSFEPTGAQHSFPACLFWAKPSRWMCWIVSLEKRFWTSLWAYGGYIWKVRILVGLPVLFEVFTYIMCIGLKEKRYAYTHTPTHVFYMLHLCVTFLSIQPPIWFGISCGTQNLVQPSKGIRQ